MIYLTPHTPEWFKAFAARFPKQAIATRRWVESAGGMGVCSMCGDIPAFHYKIKEMQFSADIGGTMGLCVECVEIRKRLYSETVIKMEG